MRDRASSAGSHSLFGCAGHLALAKTLVERVMAPSARAKLLIGM
jgi:hypothetical protein